MSQTVSTKLQRIAEQARENPKRVFTNIAYLIDVEFLEEAYRGIKKSSAPGIDGITAREYSENLKENLKELHARLRSQKYKAPPVKRVWIDKEDGSKREIAIATLEDKIAQRAVSMIMKTIYEEDFYNLSYGFRENRDAHQAVKELREQCWKTNVGNIIDADISGYFDSIDRKILRTLLKRRINDKSIIRLIGKWLNAGIMEEQALYTTENGCKQGAPISPLLANIYLHYALDEWYSRNIHRLAGRSFMIRFADDFVIGCEYEEDARRIMRVLSERFEMFNLKIHPDKTKMITFKRPKKEDRSGRGNGTFDFLGFTHFWAKSRKGNWVIKAKTAKKRLCRTMKKIWQWCKYNRHMPIEDQHRMLSLKLTGHYNYYGISCNYKMLEAVYEHLKRSWKYWLSRRSNKGHINYEKFNIFLKSWYLPSPKIVCKM